MLNEGCVEGSYLGLKMSPRLVMIPRVRNPAVNHCVAVMAAILPHQAVGAVPISYRNSDMRIPKVSMRSPTTRRS
jgi:hypothetical protein